MGKPAFFESALHVRIRQECDNEYRIRKGKTSMRKAVFTLLVLVGVCQPAAAQQSSAWADKLFGGDLVHDFGVVPRGAQLKYSFKMTNIYKVPLEISSVRVSCG